MKTRQGTVRSWRLIASVLASTCLGSWLAPSAGAQTVAAFQDGDRWAVLGDSITHGGSFHQWVDLFYLTRHPDRSVTMLNCGISGDTAAGALQRLEWDVLAKRPTVVSVMFGMNDVGRALYAEGRSGPEVERERRERIDSYRENLRNLVDRLQAAGVRVILFTPSIYDQTAVGESPRLVGVNEALAACAQIVRDTAVATGAGIVDVFALMDRINREQQTTRPEFTIVGPDRVHPEAPGHLVMAYALLRAQQAPRIVARLSIDLASGAVVTENGSAEDVRKQADGGLLFTWGARALPFPVAPEILPAMGLVPFVDELNQEVLTISGLRRGNYELRVDDARVGVFTAEQFAAGLNIATSSDTPQHVQSLDVLRLVEARGELVSENLRRIAQVEFRVAPAVERPVGLDQIKPLVQERLFSLEPGPANASFRRALELYEQRKVRESEAVGSADRLLRLARLTAQPRSHIYLIRPVR
ncbi:SGNH/GDSL hydrolase family protein [Opitutales bacterium ASA1]|uniref:SGNH/GDSL hydrolase family protein n=1 Tax=Congregicoccus parvus TaxID=3081749 RepID=UPI002B306EA5|nr:SGNH/GDSL hydrolase family protein [Opitutales bacterium ASA1]